jgi:hypothetical protein
MSQAILLRYDPHLVEETVFLALRQRPETREFQNQRDRVYEVIDADERERCFDALHRSWFARLKLSKVVDQGLQEQPSIASNVESCFVVCAAQAKEEGAELFVAPDEEVEGTARRIVSILLRPESLLQPESLLTFLRHELFHVADMLEPTFAYEPTLPKAEGGPTYDTLITNRYRALWDVTINGRMVRRGWISERVRDEQFAEFVRAFPMLEEKSEELFSSFFNGEQHPHTELAAFAFDPRAVVGTLHGASAPGTHCPLCRFPTQVFEPEPDHLGPAVLATIRQDFPQWLPALGLCAQCADLYRANRLSLAAAQSLPGWRPCPSNG